MYPMVVPWASHKLARPVRQKWQRPQLGGEDYAVTGLHAGDTFADLQDGAGTLVP